MPNIKDMTKRFIDIRWALHVYEFLSDKSWIPSSAPPNHVYAPHPATKIVG